MLVSEENQERSSKKDIPSRLLASGSGFYDGRQAFSEPHVPLQQLRHVCLI